MYWVYPKAPYQTDWQLCRCQELAYNIYLAISTVYVYKATKKLKQIYKPDNLEITKIKLEYKTNMFFFIFAKSVNVKIYSR